MKSGPAYKLDKTCLSNDDNLFTNAMNDVRTINNVKKRFQDSKISDLTTSAVNWSN